MNWEALGVIVEAVSALTVVATLFFLVFEIRNNTKALRRQAHESMVAGYATSTNAFAEHAGVMARAVVSTYDDFLAFPDEEKVVYFSVMFGFFKHFEQMYVQYERDLITDEEWGAWSEHLRMQFHQPGVQWWWALRKTSFLKSFRDYLDRSTPPDMTSMSDVLQDRSSTP